MADIYTVKVTAQAEEEPRPSYGIHKMTVQNFLIYFGVDEGARKVQVAAVVYGGHEQMGQLTNMSIG